MRIGFDKPSLFSVTPWQTVMVGFHSFGKKFRLLDRTFDAFVDDSLHPIILFAAGKKHCQARYK